MRTCVAILALTLCSASSAPPPVVRGQAQAAPAAVPALTDAQMEEFLLNAKVLKSRGGLKGVTDTIRATLSDGNLTHDAHIQTVEISKREFQGKQRTEFNFRDSWTFNVAAYKLDRLIGLNLVPVSVKRNWRTEQAAYTWWVDNYQMDEEDRLKKKTPPPDPQIWNEQMQLVRVFDQLIYNTDRNLGNLLITNDWRIWAIDHTRAFRQVNTLREAKNLTRCDRQVLERLKQLDKATLKKEVGEYLTDWDIDALLARRNLIVADFEKKGPGALFDRHDKSVSEQ